MGLVILINRTDFLANELQKIILRRLRKNEIKQSDIIIRAYCQLGHLHIMDSTGLQGLFEIAGNFIKIGKLITDDDL